MDTPILPELDLKAQRKEAGLTQADMAKRLGVTQSQVLRYEAEPDNVPVRIAREWLAACGQPGTRDGVDFGRPYASVIQRLERLRDYAGNQPALARDDTIVPPIGIEDLITAIGELGRKPRIVVCGRFDAGKSRLANTLLGKERLPTAYQPATRIVCFIRHISDKPAWQAEDVWIMDDRFQLADAADQQACEPHRLVAGDFDTLRRYGTHQGDAAQSDAGISPGAALVYLDAPLLHACDLIDTPGLGHDQDDDVLATTTQTFGDAVLYLSPINGFINGEDLRAVAMILEALPAQAGENPLRSLAVLATHTHPGVTDADVASALEHGSIRLHKALAPRFANKAGGVSVLSPSLLRGRFFPWYVETSARRKAFEADLSALLGSILPRATYFRLNDAVASFHSQADLNYAREVAQLQTLLQGREVAGERFATVMEAEPARKRRIKERQQRVEQIIIEAKSATQGFLQDVIAPLFTEAALRKMIDQQFSDSKDAEEQAGTVILTKARLLVERFLEDKAAPLTQEVENLLGEYDLHVGNELQQITVPFDARAAFLGTLAGGGAFGALAGWATVVAGGSNLGAYLLVPQVVSLLARLGIGIAGGTATGVSIVSALGGPVGVGIGIAVTVGMLAWQIFGRSWQARLARKLADALVEKNLLGEIWVRCERCWDDTLVGFGSAARATERQHGDHLARLQAQLETPTEVLRQRLTRVDARRSFLSFLPWTQLQLEGVRS